MSSGNNPSLEEVMVMLARVQKAMSVRIKKDEARIAGLEKHFQMLLELARSADERTDSLTENMAALTEKVDILVNSQIRTDERFSSLSETMKSLAESHTQTDARLASLAEAQTRLSEAQTRADARLDSFMATVERLVTERRNGQS